MDEFKGFVPVIVGLFVVFLVVVAVGGAISWLFANPFVLILLVAAVSGLVYFWIKRHRARTMV